MAFLTHMQNRPRLSVLSRPEAFPQANMTAQGDARLIQLLLLREKFFLGIKDLWLYGTVYQAVALAPEQTAFREMMNMTSLHVYR